MAHLVRELQLHPRSTQINRLLDRIGNLSSTDALTKDEATLRAEATQIAITSSAAQRQALYDAVDAAIREKRRP